MILITTLNLNILTITLNILRNNPIKIIIYVLIKLMRH